MLDGLGTGCRTTEWSSAHQDWRLGLLRHPVGVRLSCAWQPVDHPVGAVDLVVPANIVELLERTAHDQAALDTMFISAAT